MLPSVTPRPSVVPKDDALAAALAAVETRWPDARPVGVQRCEQHTNPRLEVRYQDGRTLVVKRGEAEWVRQRFAASRAACGLLRRRTGVLAPEPILMADSDRRPPLEVYWKVELSTLADVWPRLDASARTRAPRLGQAPAPGASRAAARARRAAVRGARPGLAGAAPGRRPGRAAWGGPPEADVAVAELIHGPLFHPLPDGWMVEFRRGYGEALDGAAVAFYRAVHLANLGSTRRSPAFTRTPPTCSRPRVTPWRSFAACCGESARRMAARAGVDVPGGCSPTQLGSNRR